jgi:hypothetical protein
MLRISIYVEVKDYPIAVNRHIIYHFNVTRVDVKDINVICAAIKDINEMKCCG